MGASDGGVHEDNVLVAANIQHSVAESPAKGSPVKAQVVMEDILSIAWQVWQGQL